VAEIIDHGQATARDAGPVDVIDRNARTSAAASDELELADNLTASGAADGPPEIDVNVFRNEFHRTVAQKEMSTTGVLAVGCGRDAPRREHA